MRRRSTYLGHPGEIRIQIQSESAGENPPKFASSYSYFGAFSRKNRGHTQGGKQRLTAFNLGDFIRIFIDEAVDPHLL